MGAFWTSLSFLVGTYWPFLAAAALVGMVTGWLSLSRPASNEGSK